MVNKETLYFIHPLVGGSQNWENRISVHPRFAEARNNFYSKDSLLPQQIKRVIEFSKPSLNSEILEECNYVFKDYKVGSFKDYLAEYYKRNQLKYLIDDENVLYETYCEYQIPNNYHLTRLSQTNLHHILAQHWGGSGGRSKNIDSQDPTTSNIRYIDEKIHTDFHRIHKEGTINQQLIDILGLYQYNDLISLQLLKSKKLHDLLVKPYSSFYKPEAIDFERLRSRQGNPSHIKDISLLRSVEKGHLQIIQNQLKSIK